MRPLRRQHVLLAEHMASDGVAPGTAAVCAAFLVILRYPRSASTAEHEMKSAENNTKPPKSASATRVPFCKQDPIIPKNKANEKKRNLADTGETGIAELKSKYLTPSRRSGAVQ